MIKLIYLKKLGKSSLISIIILLISLFIVTLLNYFNILSSSTLNVFTYIIPFIAFFTGSLILGKKSNSKGFLEGIKFASIFIILFILINLILKLKFSTGTFIFYIIVLSSSIIGSIIGINRQKK